MERTKIMLDENDLPKQWYNIQADLPEPMPPSLNPKTKKPLTPDDLAPLFPMGLIMQEVSKERWIDIPREVLDVYKLFRPSPLIRALRLEKEPTDLAVLTSEIVASFRVQADAAGIELSTDIMPDLPLLDVDPARIRQVLDNLITNALRYTPSGGTIRVQCHNEYDTRVTIEVGDTGKGIPPDELVHIFDRFYKSSDSRGTGLGLAIAKNLVAAHGGEISAESELGKGTTIRLSIPVGS